MSGTPRCGGDRWARRYSTGSESDRVLAVRASDKSTRSLSLPVPYHFIRFLVCRRLLPLSTFNQLDLNLVRSLALVP
jgi:hypothetical protein